VINSKGVPFFTQLMGNRIGSIDPVTMQVREYFLREGTGPRRLAVMPDDIIYYTDYARGKLGRLDPATGRTKEWTSPSGARSQPYAITASGRIVWYVEGNANPNMLVRFDPATEKFQTWPIKQVANQGRQEQHPQHERPVRDTQNDVQHEVERRVIP